MALHLPLRIERLPSLPTVLSNLLAALDNESTSTQDIEHILEQDQSTTSKLLSLANSAYYGLRHQVTSINRAVTVLGLDEVRSICLGTVLASMLGPRGFADEESARQLWRHSLATQQAAKLLAAKSGAVSVGVAMTAGLLHDLGWVVLMAYQPQAWRELHLLMEMQGQGLGKAEASLGFSHQEVGIALARHWDLPPMLSQVMGEHHAPQASQPHAAEVGLVHLTDILAGQLGQGPWAWRPPDDYPRWLLALLALDQARLEQCRQELMSQAGDLETLWSEFLDG